MTYTDAIERAERYAAERGILVDYERRLGVGQEGFVWKTNRDSAIKVFDRSENFARERACYEILRERRIFSIRGFTVPEYLDSDERLRVIEMSIVSPPYILDFGKAWVNERPDFPQESLHEHQLETEEMFGES